MRAFNSEIDRRKLIRAAAALAGSSMAAGAHAAVPLEPASSSLDEMIGEMIIMGFRGASPGSPGAESIASALGRGLIGGVIFFEDNLVSPASVRRLTRAFRDAAGWRRPYLGVDQEGGAIARLRADRGFEPLPAAQAVATTSPTSALALYSRTAQQLSSLGINLNFGPVVDLALNDKSRIITELGRSYSRDPAVVVEYAKAFVDAHRRYRVQTALKHFPGHGSTAADSHATLPDITSTWSQKELQPFAELTNSGYADMVMVGHLMHASLTEPGRPASLSPKAVNGLLRHDLGFKGAVVSDDMQMGALRRHFSPDDSILLGIEAGVDLFIFSNREHPDAQMPQRFHRVVKSAIESGRLTGQRIAESARRLAWLKGAMRVENARLAR